MIGGSVFKRKLPSGTTTWGYSIDRGRDSNGKRLREFKSGYPTKGSAKDALNAAIKEQDVLVGRVTEELGLLGRRVWAFSFRDVRETGFESKEAAQGALEAARARLAEVQKRPTTRTVEEAALTLEKFFTTWIRDHASRTCAPKTLERYGELGQYFCCELGHLPINGLKTADIQTAIHRLSDHGGRKTEDHPKGRPLAPKTVRHIGTLLYTCLGEADRLGVMTIPHPMANKRVKLPKLIKRKPPVIDEEKLTGLFSRAKGTRLFPFVVLGASTACRRGELLALNWPDINLETCEVNVSKSLEQTKAGLRVKSTKSGESRKFSIPEFAIEVLKAHREEQDRDRAMFGADYQDHGLVFCQPNGDYYSPDRVGARVSELMHKCGLEGVSLHSLRHSCATILLSNGVPLAVVSEQLGHANQNITLSIYSHAIPADKRAAASVWNNVMADVIDATRKSGPGRMVANGCTPVGRKSQVIGKKGKSMAGTTGLEPATSDVTGRRSNQLNYVPALAGKTQVYHAHPSRHNGISSYL